MGHKEEGSALNSAPPNFSQDHFYNSFIGKLVDLLGPSVDFRTVHASAAVAAAAAPEGAAKGARSSQRRSWFLRRALLTP